MSDDVQLTYRERQEKELDTVLQKHGMDLDGPTDYGSPGHPPLHERRKTGKKAGTREGQRRMKREHCWTEERDDEDEE